MRSNVLRLLAGATAAAAVVLGTAGFAAAPARAALPAVPVQSHRQVRVPSQGQPDPRATSSRSPQLVFFGGSRSQRFDPAFARRKTGLRSVNISTSSARPEAAWGILNWFYAAGRTPKIRWVWGMQSGMLRDRDLDPALLQDARFYRYFPDDLLAQQRALLPQKVGDMPRSYWLPPQQVLRSRLLPLERVRHAVRAGSHAQEVTRRLHRAGCCTSRRSAAASEVPDSRAGAYFEKTVRLLNEHGTSPVIVLMPIHPRVLRVMREHGMGGERQKLRDYLAALGQTAQIKVLDMTTINSFNGRAGWFYDGVHINRGNSNRVILAVKRKAGDSLK